MANDFSGDSDCMLWSKMEDGSLERDEISNDDSFWINNNSVASSATHKEGSYSAEFVETSSQYFSRADRDLPANFPLKTGDSNKIFSVGFWVYMNGTDQMTFFSKCQNVGERSLRIEYSGLGVGTFRMYIGYGGGASWEEVTLYTETGNISGT